MRSGPRRPKRRARLLYGDSQRDANVLYASGFFAPDPFPLILDGSRCTAILSDLEMDRAASAARVGSVVPLSECLRRAGTGGLPGAIAWVLRDLGINSVEVPANFPLGLASCLRARRIGVVSVPDPFFSSRERKSEEEIRHIRAAQRAAEAGLDAALTCLRRARIGKDGFLRLGGGRLTSERVRAEIHAAVIRRDCVPSHTIVAGGNQGCDPHEAGHGPLRAHRPVVIDIFPRSDRTGYWGDLTRTVVRGCATDRVRKAHALVFEGQRTAFRAIRAGARCASIHQAIMDLFTKQGFPTGRHRGRMRGFFHGTGHGVGLDIHEAPRISAGSARLKTGNVVTVEPGLYEWGVGGMRLEDLVVVTRSGCRNLTRANRTLEI